MAAVFGRYLFACGKTSNMQLSQNSLSLQAIWLEVNWSMTDPIYSVSRWLIFFCCCIWHKCNCVSSLLKNAKISHYTVYRWFKFLESLYMDISIFAISWLSLASVAEQAGLHLTWSETPEDRVSPDVAHLICTIGKTGQNSFITCMTRTPTFKVHNFVYKNTNTDGM